MVLLRCLITISRFWLLGTATVNILTLTLIGVYSRSNTRGFTNKLVPPRCLFSISRLWCHTQFGFDTVFSMSFLLGFTNNSALLRCRLFPRRFSLPLVLLRCCLFSRLFGFTMTVVLLRCRLLYHTHTSSFPLHRVARRIRLLSTLNLDRYGHVHLTS